MRLAVIGVVQCTDAAGRAVVPPRRERVLLAVLALDRRRVWSVDELADAVWNTDAPKGAAKLVRNRVSSLRARFGGDVIASVAGGYRLGDAVVLDIDDLRGAARNDPIAGEHGRPFVELDDWGPAWPAIARITEQLRRADEDALADALHGAPGRDLTAVAAALVAEQPLRERRWVLLVRALHTTGRRRDALDAAHQARRTFADVGLPSPLDLDTAERAVIAELRADDSSTPDDRLRPQRPQLFGRGDDVGEVERLLAEYQLVTLTGPGGVGKTALALEVAARIAHHFPDGVWICDLATVDRPDELPAALATTLRLRPDGGIATPETIATALRLQSSLVLLDNCEHVIDGVASLVTELLRRTSTIVLATSREPLALVQEHVHVVSPLDIDEAAALFAVRRRSSGGRGGAEENDPALVRELCTRLDGLPLAIELAARRAAVMSLTDLVERIAERVHLLRSDRAVDVRHRSLEAIAAWSYALLDGDEQMVFDRLSVFRGSFTLEAAEAVCADHDGIDADAVAGAVLSLASKSMVVADDAGRYRLLETLRTFGDGRLIAAGVRDERRNRHAEVFARFATDAHRGLLGRDAARWLAMITADWDNLRAAFTWALDHERLDDAVTIATHTLWVATYHDSAEPYAWVETLGTRPQVVHDHQNAASVLGGCAWAAFERGEVTRAIELADASLAAERHGRPNIDGFAELTMQSAAYIQGRLDDCERWLERAEARARAAGDDVLEATVGAVGRVILALGRGNLRDAQRYGLAARALAQRAGSPTVEAWTLAWHAEALRANGDQLAAETAREAAALAASVRSPLPLSTARRVLAREHIAAGRTDDAARLVFDCLRTMRRRGSALFVAMYVGLTVPVLTAAFVDAVAARLLGAFLATPVSQYRSERPVFDGWHAALAARLPAGELDALLAEGGALPLEAAAALAEVELARLQT